MDQEQFIKNIKFWNWQAYRDDHTDLNGKSQNFLLKHVLIKGIKENRNIVIDKKNKHRISKNTIKKQFNLLLPKDFYWNEYISLYDDLQHMNENDAMIHYIFHGNYEGRKYKCNIKYSIDSYCNDYLTKIKNNIKTPDFFNYPLLDDNLLNNELDSDTIKYNNDVIDKINNTDNIDINWNFWGKDQLNIKRRNCKT